MVKPNKGHPNHVQRLTFHSISKSYFYSSEMLGRLQNTGHHFLLRIAGNLRVFVANKNLV